MSRDDGIDEGLSQDLLKKELDRYWLKVGDGDWYQTDRDGFIRGERRAGFFPKGGGNNVATAGFSSSGPMSVDIQGRTTCYLDTRATIEERYGWDPEFVKAFLEGWG